MLSVIQARKPRNKKWIANPCGVPHLYSVPLSLTLGTVAAIVVAGAGPIGVKMARDDYRLRARAYERMARVKRKDARFVRVSRGTPWRRSQLLLAGLCAFALKCGGYAECPRDSGGVRCLRQKPGQDEKGPRAVASEQ
jgi:hypothetical protein